MEASQLSGSPWVGAHRSAVGNHRTMYAVAHASTVRSGSMRAISARRSQGGQQTTSSVQKQLLEVLAGGDAEHLVAGVHRVEREGLVAAPADLGNELDATELGAVVAREGG